MKETQRKSETVTREVTVAVVCDLCGERHKEADTDADEGVEWAYSQGQIEATALMACEGEYWPDSGHKTVTAAHVCVPCMVQRVFPALRKLGVTFREIRRDW